MRIDEVTSGWTCPKCGYAHEEYEPDYKYVLNTEKLGDFIEEYIQIACQRCGYREWVDTLDTNV